MGGVRRGLTLVGLLLAVAAGGSRALAQLATTTVQDLVYRADGTLAGGSVVVSWNAFTTANGTAVTAGSTTVTIATGGVLTIALAPNAGSTPMGSYYTAVFHLNDGTTTREYWVVPVTVAGGATTVKLAAISTPVLPISVAMQTVSKAYVDNAIAAAQAGVPFDASPYVLKAGDTMTGPLVLPADPASANQAADKNYVDENITAITTGLGEKVSLVPAGTQVVSQPAGTQLEVNLLNGEVYATQYLSGSGNNGVGNALASADCASGCTVKVEQTYPGIEGVLASELPPRSRVEDDRGGTRAETMVDPLSPVNGVSSTATSVANVSVRSAAALSAQIPGETLQSYAMTLQNSALTGGSNGFPSNVETVPYFKSTYGVMSLRGVYNTQGQHVQLGNEVDCYGVGDCLAGGQFILSEGGYRDNADEGAHPFDLRVAEDNATFTGTCTTGCTTGSTSVAVTAITGNGTQGDGRFLIDKNPAKVIGTGALTGNGIGVFGVASFTGTSFPVSVFLTTTQAATSQATNMAPGTVTLGIATSGVTTGFATNTAALPATSGVACVADPPGITPSFETANYNVVDGTHVQLTLNKVHESGATIAVGGLCGYGLESTVDTTGAIRQVFPVIGSVAATVLYYAQGITGVAGTVGQTSAFLNATFTVASIARTGGVVTVITAANLSDDVSGLTMNVSGVADSSYNGSYAMQAVGPNRLTYTNAGADSSSSGGTVSLVTGGFALYPMAEVLSVYDAATKTVDGTFTLAPNDVAWATGDAIEQPHYYQQRTAADFEEIVQYVPRPTALQSAGKIYEGVVGPGLRGWLVQNSEPASDYIGSGGTHRRPDDAYVVSGVWGNDFEVDAGENAVMRVHCSALGCNRWDSGYQLFALDSATGGDSVWYYPQASFLEFALQGTYYAFSQAGFSAPTINVGTLNATTITGGVSGGSITSGTISAARLPLFGPSGTTHAPGIVPDPGATAGATRFLREDGTWDVPVGASGPPTGAAGGDLGGSYPDPSVVQAQGGAVIFGAGHTVKAQQFIPTVTTTPTTIGADVATGGDEGVMVEVGTNNYVGMRNLSAFGGGYPGITGAGFQALNAAVSVENAFGIEGTMIYLQNASGPSAHVCVGYEVATAGCPSTLTVDGTFSAGSANQFTVDTSGNTIALSYTETLFTPASSTASCTVGQFGDDANFHYVCVSANVWKRVALSSF